MSLFKFMRFCVASAYLLCFGISLFRDIVGQTQPQSIQTVILMTGVSLYTLIQLENLISKFNNKS